MRDRFISSVTPPAETTEAAWWFLFQGLRLLVMDTDGGAAIPRLVRPSDIGLPVVRWQYLGYLESQDGVIHCYGGELDDTVAAPAGMRFENLRALYPRLDETSFSLAGRAIQIVDWDRSHQFCSRCGQAMTYQTHERAKICPSCGLTSYPRLAPAIIVRVERYDEDRPRILLARAQRFPTTMFSVLAGFVEPGETLEECVEREIREEVGLEVTDIRYFGSQPWPFPHSLMIAFVAQYESGQIAVDTTELAEADWYEAGALPRVPPPPSIANRLITTWHDQFRDTRTPLAVTP